MMQNKGMEVSINFIVILIICIVVLGFGISIFTNLFQEAEGFSASVSDSNKARLDEMLDSGEPVVVLRNVRKIRVGEDDIFQLAVSNTGNNAKNFKIEIDETSHPTGTTSIQNDVIYGSTAFELQPKERRYIPFKVEIPGGADAGTYILKVTVKDTNGNTYFHPVNVYVNVP